MGYKNNKRYYIILSLFSLFLFVYTIINTERDKKRYLLPLFLALTGLNYILEYFVLVIGKAYRYYPENFKNSYFDNIFGSNISQLLVVPTTGLLISIFNLKYRWSLLFTLIITSIEILFVKKKVFKNYWWKTYFTIIGLQLFYLLAKFWRSQLIDKKNKAIELLTVFFSIFVTHTTLMFYQVSLLKTFLFNINWFKNPFRNHVAFGTVYAGISSIVIITSVLIKNSIVKFISIVLLLLGDLFLIRIKVLKISNRLFYLVSPLIKLINLWVGHYVYRLIYVKKS